MIVRHLIEFLVVYVSVSLSSGRGHLGAEIRGDARTPKKMVVGACFVLSFSHSE